jgi:hypothetical protein
MASRASPSRHGPGPSRPSPASAAHRPAQRGTRARPRPGPGASPSGSWAFRRYAHPRRRNRCLPGLYLTFTEQDGPGGLRTHASAGTTPAHSPAVAVLVTCFYRDSGEHRCRRPGWPCGPVPASHGGGAAGARTRPAPAPPNAARWCGPLRRSQRLGRQPVAHPDPPHLQGGSQRHHRHLELVGCLSAGGARERRMLAKASAGRTLTCCSGLWRTRACPVDLGGSFRLGLRRG